MGSAPLPATASEKTDRPGHREFQWIPDLEGHGSNHEIDGNPNIHIMYIYKYIYIRYIYIYDIYIYDIYMINMINMIYIYIYISMYEYI